MKKLLFVSCLLFFLFSSQNLRASHILGGEIYYDYLGANLYKITFDMYRDCNPGPNSVNSFDQMVYTIYNSNGSIQGLYAVNPFMTEPVAVSSYSPCVNVPTNLCLERGVYIDTVMLMPSTGGYDVSFSRCCWAPSFVNVADPNGVGLTLTARIPGTSAVSQPNSSSRFSTPPPVLLCNDNPFSFDHSATDPDGDSLVYELTIPFTGGDIIDPAPDPDDAPPYNTVTWNNGFSTAQPFGPGSSFTVNAQTGIVDVTPSMIGNYVSAIRVNEYRNGILISSHARTFGYRVVACQVETHDEEVTVYGPTQIIEDCGTTGFIVSRTDTTESFTANVYVNGTAINGTDYTQIPNSVYLPQGVFADTIEISAFYDGIAESTETIEFSIIIPNVCDSTFDTTSVSITILDYNAMSITATDSVNICSEMGETVFIGCNVSGGVPPYGYYWQPGGQTSDSILVTGSMLQPNFNAFIVYAEDACSKEIASPVIKVFNQCPLTAPNVITMNGDGKNDVFFIENLDNFNKVSLTVVDRWGVVVYENDNYKNDWGGIDVSGKQLIEGVYFFTVTPESEKFDYDDVERSQFTLHGFINIFD